MQSIAPHIIKHFIPYEFSKNVLDLKVVPKKTVSIKIQNPLQNMKLRNLEKEREREIVFTYKNKSNAMYRSRKSINYRHLFHELEQEHNKRNLIKEQMQQVQKNSREKEPQPVRVSRGSINQPCFQEREQMKDRGYRTFRKLHTEQMKRRANISSRRQTAEESTKAPNTHRLYSSINFREYNQRIIADFSKNSVVPQSPQSLMGKQSIKKLKIRGRQAPESQMVDHLRRSSTASDLVISINQFDKKR